jgi:tRNA dimethylallyltransferase
LTLAKHFHGAILNCDSLQTYQRLDIGTAKPPAEERLLVPHFLFDVVAPPNVLTAGDFRRLALEVLARELPKGPVFGVGGSGFYIQALEKGMFDVPKPKIEVERFVRRRLEEHGLAFMYAELLELDPEYGEGLSPHDAYRITRALIMIHDSGKKVSDVRRTFEAEAFPYPLLKLGLAPTREELLPRVEKRVEQMMADGFLKEVEGLMADGLSAWPPLQSVGYKECVQFLNAEIEEKRLVPLIVEKTMQLAKKQKTWFKRDTGIHWLHPSDAVESARQAVAEFLRPVP